MNFFVLVNCETRVSAWIKNHKNSRLQSALYGIYLEKIIENGVQFSFLRR